MAMQVTLFCDRCGNQYKNYTSKNGFMGIQAFRKNDRFKARDMGPFYYGKKCYLCPSCMSEIESWMFDEKNDDECTVDQAPDDEFGPGEDTPLDENDVEL